MGAALTDAQLWTVCQNYWGTGHDALVAFSIAHAESGAIPDRMSPANRDGTTDYGLFQINSSHGALLASGNWSDPMSNGSMAYQLYTAAGNKFTPWTTYNTGAYAPFMARAQAAESAGGAPVPSGGTSSAPAATTSGSGSNAADPIGTATSGSTWLRIGMFLAGGLLAFIVLIAVVKNTSVVKAAKHVAVGAALA